MYDLVIYASNKTVKYWPKLQKKLYSKLLEKMFCKYTDQQKCQIFRCNATVQNVT